MGRGRGQAGGITLSRDTRDSALMVLKKQSRVARSRLEQKKDKIQKLYFWVRLHFSPELGEVTVLFHDEGG